MYCWKVVLEHDRKIIELAIKAKSYADTYINSRLTYSGCKLLSIQQSEPITTEKHGDTDKN